MIHTEADKALSTRSEAAHYFCANQSWVRRAGRTPFPPRNVPDRMRPAKLQSRIAANPSRRMRFSIRVRRMNQTQSRARLAHAPSDPRQPAESAHRKAAAEAVAESDRENPEDFLRPSQVLQGGRRKQIQNKFRGTAPGPCCRNCEHGRGCRYVRNSAPASRARLQHSRKPGT